MLVYYDIIVSDELFTLVIAIKGTARFTQSNFIFCDSSKEWTTISS